MTGFRLPPDWPPPADPAAAAILDDALAAPLSLDRDDPDRDARRAMVAALGGNSPFLSDLARRETALLRGMVRHGPSSMLAASLRRLRLLRPDAPRAEIAAGLRRAKRQVALLAALADLGGLWSLDQVTGALSLLAETALRVAVSHLLRAAQATGQIALPDPRRPERGSGFVVLGMGKLGARELNYSSDIDLVLIFDPDTQRGMADPARGFARIAAGLVSLMETRDADGYVFRTDLRLRPDPGATPPVLSLPAAITYYESYGRTWERAAMTKARPVAGDLAAGARFLRLIEPFIWRRHLDFAAIDDIQAMKRRIDRNKPAPARGFAPSTAASPVADAPDTVAALLGHDLKLGHGGIREIEFMAQTLQLVWAGRAPALRDPSTLGALRRLAAAGHLRPEEAESLARCYERLRGLEHRLQMRDDRQTHALPVDPRRFEAFALFAGAGDARALANALLPELRQTRARFEAMVRGPAGEPDQGRDEAAEPEHDGKSGFDPDAGDAGSRLSALGFASPGGALEILRRWQEGGYRALREQRARTLLAELVPSLLRAVAAQADPDGVLARFDTLLSRQNAGVQLLSLLRRTPSLLRRIGVVLGASPGLGDHLAAVPEALDGLLQREPPALAGRAVLRNLDRQMRDAGDVERAIRIARTLVRGEEFRLAVAELDAALSLDRAAASRTALADRVIAHMLRIVRREHERRHGTVPGGAIGVVALGKAGSREMMSGSDLDLMLIYHHPPGIESSVTGRGGGRSLPSSQYFARLAHALIAALGAPGVEGPLYALDMRLRPSGSKGPVAVSLDAFRRYHAEQSWTWERMALTRARIVAAPPALHAAIGDALDAALLAGRLDPDRLRADASAMRARLQRDLPARGAWDVKLRPGGLMEVEFVAQVLQLVAGSADARHPTTRIALGRLRRAGILRPDEARALIEADRFWRTLQSRLRILLGTRSPDSLPGPLPPASIGFLLSGGIAVDLDGLSASCEAMAARVRALFERLVGPVPVAVPPAARATTTTDRDGMR